MDYSLENYYPEWLNQGLFWNDFPWKSAQPIKLPKFLSEYTLHDSTYIGLWATAFDTVLLLRWDTFWTEGRVPYPSSTVAEWPFLLIKFSQVYQFNSIGTQNYGMLGIIGSATSNLINHLRREELLSSIIQQNLFGEKHGEQFLDDNLHFTVFNLVDGREFHLLHNEETYLLCLNQEGEPLSIPDMEG